MGDVGSRGVEFAMLSVCCWVCDVGCVMLGV